MRRVKVVRKGVILGHGDLVSKSYPGRFMGMTVPKQHSKIKFKIGSLSKDGAEYCNSWFFNTMGAQERAAVTQGRPDFEYMVKDQYVVEFSKKTKSEIAPLHAPRKGSKQPRHSAAGSKDRRSNTSHSEVLLKNKLLEGRRSSSAVEDGELAQPDVVQDDDSKKKRREKEIDAHENPEEANEGAALDGDNEEKKMRKGDEKEAQEKPEEAKQKEDEVSEGHGKGAEKEDKEKPDEEAKQEVLDEGDDENKRREAEKKVEEEAAKVDKDDDNEKKAVKEKEKRTEENPGPEQKADKEKQEKGEDDENEDDISDDTVVSPSRPRKLRGGKVKNPSKNAAPRNVYGFVEAEQEELDDYELSIIEKMGFSSVHQRVHTSSEHYHRYISDLPAAIFLDTLCKRRMYAIPIIKHAKAKDTYAVGDIVTFNKSDDMEALCVGIAKLGSSWIIGFKRALRGSTDEYNVFEDDATNDVVWFTKTSQCKRPIKRNTMSPILDHVKHFFDGKVRLKQFTSWNDPYRTGLNDTPSPPEKEKKVPKQKEKRDDRKKRRTKSRNGSKGKKGDVSTDEKEDDGPLGGFSEPGGDDDEKEDDDGKTAEFDRLSKLVATLQKQLDAAKREKIEPELDTNESGGSEACLEKDKKKKKKRNKGKVGSKRGSERPAAGASNNASNDVTAGPENKLNSEADKRLKRNGREQGNFRKKFYVFYSGWRQSEDPIGPFTKAKINKMQRKRNWTATQVWIAKDANGPWQDYTALEPAKKRTRRPLTKQTTKDILANGENNPPGSLPLQPTDYNRMPLHVNPLQAAMFNFTGPRPTTNPATVIDSVFTLFESNVTASRARLREEELERQVRRQADENERVRRQEMEMLKRMLFRM